MPQVEKGHFSLTKVHFQTLGWHKNKKRGKNQEKVDSGIKKSILYPAINFGLIFARFFGKNANPR